MATVAQKIGNDTDSRCQIVEGILGKGCRKTAAGNLREKMRRMGPTHIRRRWDSVSLVRRRLTEAVDQPPAACSQIGYVALAGDLDDDTGLIWVEPNENFRASERRRQSNSQLSLGG